MNAVRNKNMAGFLSFKENITRTVDIIASSVWYKICQNNVLNEKQMRLISYKWAPNILILFPNKHFITLAYFQSVANEMDEVTALLHQKREQIKQWQT